MRTAVLAAQVAWGSLLLTGCFSMGDPSPHPTVAPIEVVATVDSCQLNRESVAAGTHDTVVVMQQGTGWVRLRQGNRVVHDLPVAPVPTPTPIQLSAGEFTVECVVDGRRSTAVLTVT